MSYIHFRALRGPSNRRCPRPLRKYAFRKYAFRQCNCVGTHPGRGDAECCCGRLPSTPPCATFVLSRTHENIPFAGLLRACFVVCLQRTCPEAESGAKCYCNRTTANRSRGEMGREGNPPINGGRQT